MSDDYFALNDLRAYPDLSSVDTYPDEVLGKARDWIESLVERVCHTSFVAKPRTELRSGNGGDCLALSSARVLSVTACSVDGTALDAGELALLVVEPGGLVYRRSSAGAVTWNTWPAGIRNIEVTYNAGYSASPPADLVEAMLTAARMHVLESRGASGVPSRATSITNEFGNVNYSTASETRPTGIPECDAVITDWRRKAMPLMVR